MNTATEATLALASHRYEAWMTGYALPFWSTNGFDGPGRGFVEHMTLDGQPADVSYKRVRVQARQIYVFSHAATLGWTGGLEAATDSFEFLLTHARASNGAWFRRVGRTGGCVDDTADLYDLAFVLFAFAWYARASGRQEPISLAVQTTEWILSRMRVPGQPGFLSTLPVEDGPLQQNPHMHLLEAMLALYVTSKRELFAATAAELLTLFEEKLYDQRSGTLAEFFAPDWQRLTEVDGLAVVEPGHQFEWCWLLHQAERLLGRSMSDAALRMHEFARRFGTDSSTGLVFDSVRQDGGSPNRSVRLWPQTEAIKSWVVVNEKTPSIAAPAVTKLVDGLLQRFTKGVPAGTWIDHFGADGAPKVDKIPTSSLYHLFLAFAELKRVSEKNA